MSVTSLLLPPHDSHLPHAVTVPLLLALSYFNLQISPSHPGALLHDSTLALTGNNAFACACAVLVPILSTSITNTGTSVFLAIPA
ncbi:hypothetical protein Plhal304r1_c039g0115921 [Plasmopara halstedii]